MGLPVKATSNASKTAAAPPNRFAGLATAKVSQNGVPFTPGFEGIVEIVALKGFDSNKGKGYTIVAELEVVTSNCEEHPAGAKRSYVILYDSQMGENNFLCLMAAATGETNPNDEAFKERMANGEAAEALDESVNPLEGVQMRLSTRETMTQGTKSNPSHPFTVHTFSPTESENDNDNGSGAAA